MEQLLSIRDYGRQAVVTNHREGDLETRRAGGWVFGGEKRTMDAVSRWGFRPIKNQGPISDLNTRGEYSQNLLLLLHLQVASLVS